MASSRRRPEATAKAMISNTEDGMVLRSGTVADAKAAASLHSGQISEGFLSALGPIFLHRLYRRVVRTPGSFLFVVQSGATTVGFLAGSTDVAGLYRSFLLRDGAVALLTSGGRLLRSWRRVLETLRHGAGGPQSSSTGVELLAIAVDPAGRGHGVGALLVHEFLQETIRRNRNAAHVVVGADNATAVALYERAGFRTAKRFEFHQDTESLLMTWTAPSAAGPS